MVREQVEGLLEGGVDLLVFETASHLDDLLLAVAEARGLTDLPIVASMTFGEDLLAVDGTTPEAAAAALAAAGVDALGVNCGVGPDRRARRARPDGRRGSRACRCSSCPTRGCPRVEGSSCTRQVPPTSPRRCPASWARAPRIVGGCCGTTPEHIAAMRQTLDKELARARGTEARPPRPRRLEAGARPSPSSRRRAATAAPMEAPPPTGLKRKLAEGRFVISVEIDPPRSVRIERTIEAARLLQEAGVDLVNISDSAMARVRMGAMAVAFGIQHDLDLECLVHFTTRDRNLMAIESELLGAHALGVRDILALTGDPPRVGDYPGGTGIWDIDSTGLIGVLQRLNRGEDQTGRPIGAPAGFTVACAVDPTAGDLEHELDRLTRKLDAGADLVMTQPIYAVEQ